MSGRCSRKQRWGPDDEKDRLASTLRGSLPGGGELLTVGDVRRATNETVLELNCAALDFIRTTLG